MLYKLNWSTSFEFSLPTHGHVEYIEKEVKDLQCKSQIFIVTNLIYIFKEKAWEKLPYVLMAVMPGNQENISPEVQWWNCDVSTLEVPSPR